MSLRWIWVDLKHWWNLHFSGFTHTERWGYRVWLAFAVVVLGPELWAAFWSDSAPFPTISGTTADLEYGQPLLGLAVVGVIVLCLYSALRFPPSRTGVLPPPNAPLEYRPPGEDPFVPYRTPRGGRLTRSKTPVREIAAVLYFSVVSVAILGATTIAALVTGGTDEYAVGRTLYGGILVGWVLLPNL